MMPRFWPMFRKEFVQMRRDRLTLGIMIGVPVLQLLLFGFAIQTDVRNIPTVVLDESRTPESRDIIAAFENTGNFRIIGHVDGRPALDAAIARGDAQAAIVVPNDYPRDLARGRTAQVRELDVKSGKDRTVFDDAIDQSRTGSLARGWQRGAPYDAIVLTGSTPVLPRAFLEQLTPGGRLFAVVGEAPAMQARLTVCTAPGAWHSVDLFETVIRPLTTPSRRRASVSDMGEITPAQLAAWLDHLRREKPVLLDVREGSRTEGVRTRLMLGDGASRLLRILPGVAHGVRNLGQTTGRIIYFTDVHFSAEPASCDEGRLPWDFAGADVWEVVRG